MSATFENTVLDFDLNFLNQTSNHTGTSSVRSTRTKSSNKKSKSISHLKQRIISTDSLIAKYYDIKDDLEESQKNLVAVNEELKQLHIKYRNEIEKSNKLENDFQKSENERRIADEKCFNYLNQYEAQLSHSNQLQLLLKEKDSENHRLQIDNKDLLKKKTSFEERETTYLKDIALFKTLVKNILGKRGRNNKQKLKPKYKSLLRKYEASNDENISDWGDSDGEADIFEEVLSPPQTNVNILGKKCSAITKDVTPVEFDNEYNNEVVSIDTGRGSSLASSDNEKCLHSPDYYLNDSPVNRDNNVVKARVKVVSTGTSPISFGKMTEIATSPIPFAEMVKFPARSIPLSDMIEIATRPILLNEMIDIATSPIPFGDMFEIASCEMCLKNQNKINESKNLSFISAIHTKSQCTVDRYVSPIKINKSKSVSTSPIKEVSKSIATSPLNIFDSKTKKQIPQAHEKYCLELNNSDNIQRSDSHTDYEIEMILNEMELNYKALSPIPRTPNRNGCKSSNVSSSFNNSVKHVKNMEQIHLESELRKQKDNNETLMSVLKLICSMLPVRNENNKNNDNNIAACFKNFLNTTQDLPLNHSMANLSSNLETSHSDQVLLPDSNSVDRSSSETNMESQNKRDGYHQSPIQDIFLNNSMVDPYSDIEISHLYTDISPNDNNKALTSNRSSPDINTDIQNKQDESQISRPVPVVLLDESRININSDFEISQSEISQSVDDSNSGFKSYQPLSELNTDTLQIKQWESRLPQVSLPRLENQLLIQNQIGSRKMSTDVIPTINSEQIIQSSTKDSNVKKTQGKKISKLEKLRKNLKPKYKIRTETPPIMKSRFKRKLTFSPKKSTESGTSLSLNDKNVYAKAVKVMAEMNSKLPKTVKVVADMNLKSPKAVKVMEDHNSKSPKAAKVMADINPKSPKAAKVMADINPKSPKAVKITEDHNCKSPKAVKVVADINPKSPEAVKVTEDHNSKSPKAVKFMADINPKSPKAVKVTEDHNSKSPKAVKFMADINPKSPKAVKVTEDHNSQSPKGVKVMADFNLKSPKISSKVQLAKDLLFTKETTQLDKHLEHKINLMASPGGTILTRNKRKYIEQLDHCSVILTKAPIVHPASETKKSKTCIENQENDPSYELTQRKRRRHSSNEPEIQCKRILRSSATHIRLSIDDNAEISKVNGDKSIESPSVNKALDNQLSSVSNHQNGQKNLMKKLDQHECVTNRYADLDKPEEKEVVDIQYNRVSPCPVVEDNIGMSSCHPKNSILGQMLTKHSVLKVKPFVMNVPEKIMKSIGQKLETDIEKIIEVSSNEKKSAMNRLVSDLQKLNSDHLITALVIYLTSPERKNETFGVIAYPPAPKMTKNEEILLYVISQLQNHWPSVDLVDAVLSKIEYFLFRLNRTPEFCSVETASHFYALLCRYYRAKSRLRLFILDAMYSMQYKCTTLVKNTLEAWKEVIPLAHLPFAKGPLVTCLVYLLHFYKCNDTHNSVQEIRNILSRRYFYQITDWNERKILEMFKNAIKELRDVPLEKKIIRISLIILAKRQGARWCQKNIIKKLIPSILAANVPSYVKEFCVNMIGPLMKPYPSDMKIDCEVAISQLRKMLDNNPSQAMEEAIIKSMLCINRHDQKSVNEMLLSREMKHMSPDLQNWIRRYIKSKPLKIWTKHLLRIGEDD